MENSVISFAQACLICVLAGVVSLAMEGYVDTVLHETLQKEIHGCQIRLKVLELMFHMVGFLKHYLK
jgi:hypothetical protein